MIAFLRILILLGSLQGFIVSCMLWLSKKNRRTTRILSALIFLISLASFNLYANMVSWFGSPLLNGISNIIPMIMVMPMGPLIYFYIQASLDPVFTIGKKQRRQFYPVIIDLVPSLITITAIVCVLGKLLTTIPVSGWGNLVDTYNVYADIPRWLSITVYLWLSHKYLITYQAKAAAEQEVPPMHLAWLKLFIRIFLVFQCVWLVYLVPYVIPRYTDRMLRTFDWYPVYIPLTIMIYWLGIKGYLVAQQEVGQPVHKPSSLTALPEETIQEVIAALQKAMQQDQLYLNPALNLKMVSDHTDIPRKTISAVLNQRLDTSFNEFINGYRIEEFKKKIQQPQMNQLTIAGVALDCGFNSQATFQRAFKQVTGMSPTEFRDSSQIAI